ncbi:MAG: V-type ATP synthase subunit E family protein [Thermoprotei archaeon]
MSITSNFEELREKVINDAKKKAEEIIRRAEEEAKRIIEEAEKEWFRKAEKKKIEIINNTKRKAQITISEARTKARIIISRAKYEVIEQILSEVLKAIENRNGFDAKHSLERLLDEALQFIDKPKRVIVNPRDSGIIKEVLSERGLTDIEVAESSEIIGGIVVEDENGRRVDNSYNARLERAKTSLIPIITKELWSSS